MSLFFNDDTIHSMKRLFRLKILLIGLAALLCFPSAAQALTVPKDELIDVTAVPGRPDAPLVDAPSIILIEAGSKAILYSKDADTAYYPASITKIMTALIVIENCELEENVTFSYRATHELEAGSSGIARTEGEIMTVRDCLYALLVASANEVAQALAEHVSGSMEAFAELMNKRAAELGCTNTHFANPSGLNDENHYTTCHDMALIMCEAIKHPEFVEIDSTTDYTIPATNKHSDSLRVFMKHDLLRGSEKYKYAVCGKTGYTSLAGFTLVTSAAKDGMNLICVALHCSSAKERADSTKTLFDYGFDNYKFYSINEADPSVSGSGTGNSFLSPNVISLAVPDTAGLCIAGEIPFSSLTSQTVWEGEASLGGRIGRVFYCYEDALIGAADLLINTENDDPFAFLGKTSENADTDIEARSGEKSSFYTILIISGISVAVIVVGGIIINRFINGSMRRRKKKRRRSIR